MTARAHDCEEILQPTFRPRGDADTLQYDAITVCFPSRDTTQSNSYVFWYTTKGEKAAKTSFYFI